LTRDRPRLTERAKEALKKYNGRYSNTVLNLAEKRVLESNRTEIDEPDILDAQKNFPSRVPATSRKWCIRISTTSVFMLLVAQVAAFYQLFQSINFQNLALVIQVWLILPNIAVLLFMVIFTWIFKEDWL
jgi:hypothetical protein